MHIALLSDHSDFSTNAINLAREIVGDGLVSIRGNVGDVLPPEVYRIKADWLIAFLSPWIIPKAVLDASKKAINFHPGSAQYPGVGCYNFALYENADQYGTVCHYAEETVDTGAIIEERRFPILPTDSESSLRRRTMVTMLSLFHDVLCKIVRGEVVLPSGTAVWSRPPIRQSELERLKEITPGMAQAEVRRRIRATVCPGLPGPFVVIAGERFYFRAS